MFGTHLMRTRMPGGAGGEIFPANRRVRASLIGVIDKTTGNALPVAKPARGGGQSALEAARLQKLRATDPEEFLRQKRAANAGRYVSIHASVQGVTRKPIS